MAQIEKCIYCGAEIPEGRQVCPICEKEQCPCNDTSFDGYCYTENCKINKKSTIVQTIQNDF